MDNRRYWYNYKTKAFEFIETPQDFTDYIPQLPAAIGAYQCRLALGERPADAAREVVKLCLGMSDKKE